VEPRGFPTCVPQPRCRGQVKQRESIGARGSCEQRGLGPRHDSALDSDLLTLLRVGSDRGRPECVGSQHFSPIGRSTGPEQGEASGWARRPDDLVRCQPASSFTADQGKSSGSGADAVPTGGQGMMELDRTVGRAELPRVNTMTTRLTVLPFLNLLRRGVTIDVHAEAMR